MRNDGLVVVAGGWWKDGGVGSARYGKICSSLFSSVVNYRKMPNKQKTGTNAHYCMRQFHHHGDHRNWLMNATAATSSLDVPTKPTSASWRILRRELAPMGGGWALRRVGIVGSCSVSQDLFCSTLLLLSWPSFPMIMCVTIYSSLTLSAPS